MAQVYSHIHTVVQTTNNRSKEIFTHNQCYFLDALQMKKEMHYIKENKDKTWHVS